MKMTTENKLAITGGKPVRDSYLPYGRQWLDEDDIQSVVDVLRGDYLTTGPTIDLFEKRSQTMLAAAMLLHFPAEQLLCMRLALLREFHRETKSLRHPSHLPQVPIAFCTWAPNRFSQILIR